jgi:benzoyl-CoA reductase/2-hydroxyglutaryl-CoA dehydratase subunit BcrC/BadD/HgdB
MNKSKRESKRTVSFGCSYVPEEIIMGAGLRPRRMIPEARPSEADAYLHPNTCGYVKSLLASLVAADDTLGAGFVFTNSCDSMRRLNDIWNARAGEVPRFFIDVPKKRDPDSIDFFASELRRFAGSLEKQLPEARLTDESLRVAIRACNDSRRLVEQVLLRQRDPGSTVRGSSVFNLCLAGVTSGTAVFADNLSLFLEDAGPTVSPRGPRIVLTGNAIHRPDLLTLIEDSGGTVVGLDTCTAGRHQDRLVVEDSDDPVRALAERYLLRAPCARMEGLEARLQYLRDLVIHSKADGIVYSMTKFCDAQAYDAPIMQDGFREAGIPFLLVEHNYEWGGLEQTRTRIEGFFEMLSERRARRNV